MGAYLVFTYPKTWLDVSQATLFGKITMSWTEAKDQFLATIVTEHIRGKSTYDAFNWQDLSEMIGEPPIACRIRYRQLRNDNKLLMDWHDWFLIIKQAEMIELYWAYGLSMLQIAECISQRENRPVEEIEIRRWHDTYLTPYQRDEVDTRREQKKRAGKRRRKMRHTSWK